MSWSAKRMLVLRGGLLFSLMTCSPEAIVHSEVAAVGGMSSVRNGTEGPGNPTNNKSCVREAQLTSKNLREKKYDCVPSMTITGSTELVTALSFYPYSMGCLVGSDPTDPAGTEWFDASIGSETSLSADPIELCGRYESGYPFNVLIEGSADLVYDADEADCFSVTLPPEKRGWRCHVLRQGVTLSLSSPSASQP